MTMIERVARTLCSDAGEDPDLETPYHPKVTHLWQHYIPAARLVIEAMREPTEEMVDAGGTANYGHPRETAVEWAKEDKWDSYAHEAKFLYTAMISAALQEGKETVG